MHIGLGGARLFEINVSIKLLCTRDTRVLASFYTIMIYDVLVIGAGIEGSAAGYNLVKDRPGLKCLLLEQVS